MALVGSLADILPDSPLSAGKNRDSTRAGLYPPMRGAASRVMRKYGSWSMAHGMRQRSDFFSAPNMCGKQSGNAGRSLRGREANLADVGLAGKAEDARAG